MELMATPGNSHHKWLTAGPGAPFYPEGGNSDVESKRVDSRGDGVRMNWDAGTDIYILLIQSIKQMVDENVQYSTG